MFQSAGSREIPADAIEKAFSGVEERLMARLEAVAGNVAAPPNSSASSPGPIATRTGNGSPMKLQNAASSVSRSWEQIKSEMMNKGELTESSSAVKPQKPATALPEVAQLTSDRHFRLPEQDLSLEIPKAIDPETVSDQELRDAFREREAFITTLIARIRRQQESATGQLSAEQLRSLVEELPDELAEQVRHTLKQMDDLARMGELELSLERARIARQVNQLAHSRQLLERNARQMGMIVNADGTIVHGPNQAGRGSGSRRWLGKLGFGQ
jgi:tape measure domain-containing protein